MKLNRREWVVGSIIVDAISPGGSPYKTRATYVERHNSLTLSRNDVYGVESQRVKPRPPFPKTHHMQVSLHPFYLVGSA